MNLFHTLHLLVYPDIFQLMHNPYASILNIEFYMGAQLPRRTCGNTVFLPIIQCRIVCKIAPFCPKCNLNLKNGLITPLDQKLGIYSIRRFSRLKSLKSKEDVNQIKKNTLGSLQGNKYLSHPIFAFLGNIYEINLGWFY